MPIYGEELVTRTKFIVPGPPRGHLLRSRLIETIDEALTVPLTLVVGGAGYGKTTLVASYLQRCGTHALWYQLTERDADPHLFALHLAHLCHRFAPGMADRALNVLAQPGGASKHGLAAIEALADSMLDRLESHTLLVIDDVHLLNGSTEALGLLNHLVTIRSPLLHLMLITRQLPDLRDLPRWRLDDQVLILSQEDLAFRGEEVNRLFDAEQVDLAPFERDRLVELTQGWPMAVRLLARRMAENPSVGLGTVGRDLFDYLAREIFETLEAPAQDFLLCAAPLSRLVPEELRALTGSEPVPLLTKLYEQGTMLVPLGDGHFSLHPLFRDFLRARLQSEGRWKDACLDAARILDGKHTEEAIALYLEAKAYEDVVMRLSVVAPGLVSQGRFSQLNKWISLLPDEILERAPALAICQGDACRLGARYDEALSWYDRALAAYTSPEGRSRALASKALVYLDTVQPSLAERYLEKALAFDVGSRRRAELLVLLAENKLNQGDSQAAEVLFAEARAELPAAAEHEARACLRTGRLTEARAIARASLIQNAEGPGTKAHREAALILSFVEALMGEPEAAMQAAIQAVERARRQQAPWAEAVATIRQGHAHLLSGSLFEAEAAYRQALMSASELEVDRLKAEALMGLCLLEGRRGDAAMLERYAAEGLRIAEHAGDSWFSSVLGLAAGMGLASQGDASAERWLSMAHAGFERSGDRFGHALVQLGHGLLAVASSGSTEPYAESIKELGFGFLLSRPTLLGLANHNQVEAIKTVTGPPPIHDLGLRIQSFGDFRVWVDGQELSERAWSREKARQLLHLLIAMRGQRLPKARIIDILWPELDPGTADGSFRVALNALNKALEPERQSRDPRFILREGSRYYLADEVKVDATEFERLLDSSIETEAEGTDSTGLLIEALELSGGEFLAGYEHEAWERERERLSARYTEGALRLIRLLLARGDDEGGLRWVQRLLSRDACVEEAYRLQMTAYYRVGDRPQAVRAYERCVQILDQELGVPPMPETLALYERILALATV